MVPTDAPRQAEPRLGSGRARPPWHHLSKHETTPNGQHDRRLSPYFDPETAATRGPPVEFTAGDQRGIRSSVGEKKRQAAGQKWLDSAVGGRLARIQRPFDGQRHRYERRRRRGAPAAVERFVNLRKVDESNSPPHP